MNLALSSFINFIKLEFFCHLLYETLLDFLIELCVVSELFFTISDFLMSFLNNSNNSNEINNINVMFLPVAHSSSFWENQFISRYINKTITLLRRVIPYIAFLINIEMFQETHRSFSWFGVWRLKFIKHNWEVTAFD